jgi:hypothetical protein
MCSSSLFPRLPHILFSYTISLRITWALGVMLFEWGSLDHSLADLSSISELSPQEKVIVFDEYYYTHPLLYRALGAAVAIPLLGVNPSILWETSVQVAGWANLYSFLLQNPGIYIIIRAKSSAETRV